MSKDRTEELSDLAEQCASHPLGDAMPEVKQAGEAMAELLATVEALRNECTGLRAIEQNLLEELAARRKAVSDVLEWRVDTPFRGDLRDNGKSRDALGKLVKAMEAKP